MDYLGFLGFCFGMGLVVTCCVFSIIAWVFYEVYELIMRVREKMVKK